MKLLVVLVLVTAALALPDDMYDTKFDNINIDEVIDNDTLFRSYVMCCHESGPCTAEGKEIRDWMPEAVKTSCTKCSEKQKVLAAKSIKAAKAKYPKEYAEIVAMYDPEGKRAADLAAFVEKYSP